jgi:hypothetical protein
MVDRIRPFLAVDDRAIWEEHAALTSDPAFSGPMRKADHYEKPKTVLQNVQSSVATYSPLGGVPTAALTGVLSAGLRPVTGLLQTQNRADDKIGYASGPIVDSFTREYWVMGPKTRTPGRYQQQTLTPAGEAVASGAPLPLSSTCESIHPSVYARKQAPPPKGEKKYEPDALKGFTRQRTDAQPGSGNVWVSSDGRVRIREHVIGCPPEMGDDGEYDALCLERKMIRGLLPELLAKLDEDNGVQDPHRYVPGQVYTGHDPELYSAWAAAQSSLEQQQ